MNEKEISPLILVVDDDTDLVQALTRQLGTFRLDAMGCNNLREAGQLLASRFVNLLLINFEVGGESGIDFLQRLHRNLQFIPAIFLANQTSCGDRLKALELGDDVIQKPIYLRELVARIRAILRRAETSRDWHLTENATLNDEVFSFCGARVNPRDMMITFPDGQQALTGKKELGLMLFFARNPDTILSRKDVIHRIWGLYANLMSRSLDQYIVRIRQLFRTHGFSTTDRLKTIHGVGYRYASCPESRSADVILDPGVFLTDVSKMEPEGAIEKAAPLSKKEVKKPADEEDRPRALAAG